MLRESLLVASGLLVAGCGVVIWALWAERVAEERGAVERAAAAVLATAKREAAATAELEAVKLEAAAQLKASARFAAREATEAATEAASTKFDIVTADALRDSANELAGLETQLKKVEVRGGWGRVQGSVRSRDAPPTGGRRQPP